MEAGKEFNVGASFVFFYECCVIKSIFYDMMYRILKTRLSLHNQVSRQSTAMPCNLSQKNNIITQCNEKKIPSFAYQLHFLKVELRVNFSVSW